MTDTPTRLPFAFNMVGVVAGLAAIAAAGLWIEPLAAEPSSLQSPATRVPLYDDESDMLARARAERDAMRAPAPQDGGVTGKRQTSTDHVDGDEIRRRQALDAEVQRRLQEAERQAELDQISERIRQAEQARSGVGASRGQVVPATTAPVTGDVAIAPVGAATAPISTRATVLLVIEPGHKGIRRFNSTADPILCLADTCYISRGADRDADAVPRRRALGMFNTLGRRAGACRASLDCVFRNVDLGGTAAKVQPIDLRILRHDRRRPLTVHADATCQTDDGRLVCSEPARGPSWLVWVVPEPVARRAGPPGLQAALAAGLRQGAETTGSPR